MHTLSCDVKLQAGCCQQHGWGWYISLVHYALTEYDWPCPDEQCMSGTCILQQTNSLSAPKRSVRHQAAPCMHLPHHPPHLPNSRVAKKNPVNRNPSSTPEMHAGVLLADALNARPQRVCAHARHAVFRREAARTAGQMSLPICELRFVCTTRVLPTHACPCPPPCYQDTALILHTRIPGH